MDSVAFPARSWKRTNPWNQGIVLTPGIAKLISLQDDWNWEMKTIRKQYAATFFYQDDWN